MRALGFLTATALVFAGVGQAVLNGFAPNGVTILLCGVGLAIAVLTHVTERSEP